MSFMVESVAWAIPPGAKRNTRGALLLNGLLDLGYVSPDVRYFFHGKAKGNDQEINAGSVLPNVNALPDRWGACFSPVFLRSIAAGRFRWLDFYDDWSLAPDINVVHRALASLSYRSVRAGKGRAVVTCNTPYMAGKLGLGSGSVVPNGVDPSLARLVTAGDDTPRLILLGHFFPGRTDYSLIADVIDSGVFGEVIIGGIGHDRSMKALVASRQAMVDQGRLKVFDWLSNDNLAKMVGPKTVGLVPHVVSDYTLSQDLMKAYQYCGLGIRVICPRLLWPQAISMDHAFLLDYGVNLKSGLAGWLHDGAEQAVDRVKFAEDNAWSRRALSVAQILNHQLS